MKKLALVLLTICLVSCGKDSNPVPSVGVYFQGSINSPALSKLKGYGVAVTISGYGVAGLIIYHELDGSWAAYDRCSSYQPEKKCAVNIDSNNLTATDPCSGSVFSLVDGSPVKAPATQSLRIYAINVAGNTADAVITVSN